MAGVALGFIAEGLTFSSNKVPKLTRRECELLYYALSRTVDLVDEAKRVFYSKARSPIGATQDVPRSCT